MKETWRRRFQSWGPHRRVSGTETTPRLSRCRPKGTEEIWEVVVAEKKTTPISSRGHRGEAATAEVKRRWRRLGEETASPRLSLVRRWYKDYVDGDRRRGEEERRMVVAGERRGGHREFFLAAS